MTQIPELDLEALQALLPDLALEAGQIVPAGMHFRAAAVQVLDQVCSSAAPAWLWTAESPDILHNHQQTFPAGHEQRGEKPLAEHYVLAGEQGPSEKNKSSFRLGQTETAWTLWEQDRADDRPGVIVPWHLRGPEKTGMVLDYEVGFEMQLAGDLWELRATGFRFIRFVHAQPSS